MLETTPLNHLSVYLQRLIKGRLWIKVFIGLAMGILLGIVLNPSNNLVPSNTSTWMASWLELPGKMFMRLVQMIMIPLIFTSVISGIVSNNTERLRKFGLSLLIYFIITTVVAITIGVVLVLIIKPGQYISSLGNLSLSGQKSVKVSTELNSFENIPDALSNLIPNNPLQAMLSGEMLGVVIFTIIIGVAITQLKPITAQPLIRFSESVQKICMIIMSWAMRLVPFAVFGLMAALLSRIGAKVLVGLGAYMGTVLFGLIVLVIVYLLIISVFTRTNPFNFMRKIREPQLLALSTASSAIVMPLSMKVANEELGVSPKISDLVIPIGATVNMDGTALFQCITAIFLAQAYGMDLSIINIMLITITIVAASIGTPAIPGGGVIILATVLQNMGIPSEGLLVIIGIDRILGMFRSLVNVTGDLTACMVFNKLFEGK